MAHALAAEMRWMELLCLGSYTPAGAAELMNPSEPDPACILALHRSGELLAFEYAGELWVPEYQFAGGTVLPVITQLVAVARGAGASDTDLCLWMDTGSTLLTGQGTPADHLADAAQVIEAAHIHFEAVW
ncbi:MAG TPA: hypothetical protein VF867_09065 [Arthrobacter sp.]